MVERWTVRLELDPGDGIDLNEVVHLQPTVRPLGTGRCLVELSVLTPTHTAAAAYVRRRLRTARIADITVAAA